MASPGHSGGTQQIVIAEGAGHYRQPGLIERLGRALASVPMSSALRSRLKRWYVAALNFESGGKGLRAMLPEGEIVRVLPEHAHLGWNPDEYRAFRAAVRPGTIALDVGANVGAYALLLGQWVGPTGSVYAFEPAHSAFDGLSRHIALNGLEGVVQPVKTAVGATTTTLPFLEGAAAGQGRLLRPSENREAAVDIAVTTIDEFCEQRKLTPAFIKIDVEGSELDVLRGARETIRRCRSTVALFVEVHPTVWTRIGLSSRDLLEEFARQALDAEPLVPGRDPFSVEGVSIRLRPRL